MSTTVTPRTPQGSPVALGIPDSQDYPRLVFTAPYFEQVPLAEIIEPSVQEAVEALLPSLVPPYVTNAAEAAVQQLAVLLTGSTMSGALYLSPLMPTQPSQAATMAYVDAMVATAGVPEVPAVPQGQIWGRTTGQWVPISEQEGTFLPLAGGTMQGQINMSGYAINNLAALPNMPNGAAPASWVLQQIAAVSLYQGTWNMDTYTPDLTNPATHVNGYTWIAITTSTSGVVIGPAIPGLQGQTVFNGDTVIWSNIQGQFNRIHSGGLSLAEAQALFLPFTGGTMTGPLLAYENPTEAMEVATMGWVESLIPTGGIIAEAPADGQLYLRNGLTHVWQPGLPLAGGIMTGPMQLSGNATNGLSPVPLQQMNSTLSSSYLALAGGTMQGLIVLSGNASANLNPVPLGQLNSMLGGFLPISGGTLTGALTLSGAGVAPNGAATVGQLNTALGNYLPISGGTLTGPLTLSANATAPLNPVSLQQLNSAIAGYLLLSGGTMSGPINMGGNIINGAASLQTTGNITSTGGTVTGASLSATGTIFVPGGSTITPNPVTGGGWNWTASPYAFTCSSALDPAFSFSYQTTFLCEIFFAGGGNMTIGGTLTQGSDESTKTDIAPITQGVSLIRQLLPKSFQRIIPSGAPANTPPSPTQWGFIAQDVQPVIPTAVNEGGNGLLGLDMTAIIAAAVYTLKQLDQRCTALEAAASITPPAAELA